MFWKRLLFTVIAGSGVIAAQAAPRTPDAANLPAYIRAADRSHNLKAAAMFRQIAAGPAALARERAAARAAGIPLDPTQLQSSLPPPDWNAAPLYQQLTQLLTQQPMGLPTYAEPLKAGVAYTPEQIAAVQSTLAERQDVLNLIDQATARPQCVFQRDWTQGDWAQGVFFIAPEYAKMREAARLLRTESYLLARNGHYMEAIAKQSQGFRLAEHTASDPTLISQLVGLAVEAITLTGLQDILTMAGPNPEVDVRIEQVVSASHSHFSLRRAAIGETVFALSIVDQARRHGPDVFEQTDYPDATSPPSPMKDWWDGPPQSRRFYDMVMDAQAVVIVHRMLPIIAAINQPRPIRHRVFVQAEKSWALDSKNPMNIIANIALPVFSKADDKVVEHQAREQVTAAGAALLAAKARTGAFPDALPGDFPDPFTDKPLGYRREGDGGFVIFSVGADGKFDGGKPGQYEFHPSQAFFRYPGPPLQPVPPDMLK